MIISVNTENRERGGKEKAVKYSKLPKAPQGAPTTAPS